MFLLPCALPCLSRALHGHTATPITAKPALAAFAFPSPSPEPREAKYLSVLLNKTCSPASLRSRLLSLERKTHTKKKSCLPRTSPSPGRELRAKDIPSPGKEFRGSCLSGIPRFSPRRAAASGQGWMLRADAEGAGGERGERRGAGRGRREEEGSQLRLSPLPSSEPGPGRLRPAAAELRGRETPCSILLLFFCRGLQR